MRAQSSALLGALCLLLTMASVFCGESASNSTTNGTALTGNNTGASHMTTTLSAANLPTKAEDTTATRTVSTEASVLPTSARRSTTPTARSPSTSASHAKILVGLLLFFCILITLFYCAYKWYIRRGRPSCLEICGMVAESARNGWAALMELLRPSSKVEEKDEEMEAGEEKTQPDDDDGDDYNDNDDSSGNYSSVDGTAMTGGPKTNEEEDGRGNDREDDMMSVELKDEKSEGGKDNLAMQ